MSSTIAYYVSMKQTILILGSLLLVFNFIAGAILSSYHWANVVYTTIAIVVVIFFLLASARQNIKDGFKPALMLFYMVVGIMQFILLAIMPSLLTDNWYLIASLILLGMETIVWLLCRQLSTKILQ